MRICDDLRQAVLQAAIQGKLTKQFPEDGDAKDLLNITLHSVIDGRKVKEKEIADISENDIDFDIPSNWQWVKLGSVCIVARGGSPRPIKEYITDSPDGINWIKIGDTDKGGKYITSVKEKIKPSGVAKSRFVHVGDFLLTNSMSFGRPYILKVDGCIHDGWLVISQPKKVFDDDYLYWLLSSYYAYRQFCGKVSGAVVKNLNSDKVANSVFPLPPLAEQHRIVARVEELMARIDDLEKTETELEKLKAAFPGDMKAALLQAAMQGKLTEQLQEDGDAADLLRQIMAEKARLIKEKSIISKKPTTPFYEVNELEEFNIPDNWVFAQLSDVSIIQEGAGIRKWQYRDQGTQLLCVTNILDGNVDLGKKRLYVSTEEYNKKYLHLTVKNGDIVCSCSGGSWGKSAIYDKSDTVMLNTSTLRLRFFGDLSDNLFLYYLTKSEWFKKQLREQLSGMQPNFGYAHYSKIVIPLPPLAEQKRIVEKLDKLLPLCDGLVEE